MLAVFAAVLFVFSLVASIAAGDLKAALADESKVQGICTLILYACSSGCDVGNAAIFKKEGDGPSFDIAATSDQSEVKTGLAGNEVLAQAKKFVGCNLDDATAQLSKIMDIDGAILGFEVKAEHDLSLGLPYTVSAWYIMKDGSTHAWITPDTKIEMERNAGE